MFPSVKDYFTFNVGYTVFSWMTKMYLKLNLYKTLPSLTFQTTNICPTINGNVILPNPQVCFVPPSLNYLFPFSNSEHVPALLLPLL